MARVHVAVRLVLLAVLGMAGWSSLYWVAYLLLPALAALLIAQKGTERYLAEDAPGIVRILKWLARAYAYLWLLTDAPPTAAAGGPVELVIEPSGAPTTTSAMLRLLYSVPALLLLAVLSFVAAFLWVIGAVAILLTGRLPLFIDDFLGSTVKYQFHLVAYHLSLVEQYPSFEEPPVLHGAMEGASRAP